MIRFAALVVSVFVMAAPSAYAQEFKWQEGTAFALTDVPQTPLLDLSGANVASVQSVVVPDSNASLDSGYFENPAIAVPGAVESSFSGLRLRLPLEGQ